MSGVRSTSRWQRLCKQLIPQASHCAICRRPLDHAAPARTPWSPSLDHIIPISRGGAPYDRANCQVVHYGCNARKGNRRVAGPAPASTGVLESRLLPVCNGRACVCVWVGPGEPREDCSYGGPPEMVRYDRTANGWARAHAVA